MKQLNIKTDQMHTLNTQVNDNINLTALQVKNTIDLIEQARITSVEMKNISTSSTKTVKNSINSIMGIVAIINSIKNSSSKVAEYMKGLLAVSENIVNILDALDSFSRQINIMTLNASIEAARAGDAGRGFSVVVDEIRNLSENTSKSVQDVSALINNIQSEIGDVNKVVMENLQQVHLSVDESQNIEKDLGAMELSFENVTEMINEVIQLSEKEVSYINDVGNKISAVENIIVKSTKSVEDVAGSVQEQAGSMNDIAEMGLRLSSASKNLCELLDELELTSIVKNDKVGDGREQEYIGIVRKLSEDLREKPIDREEHRKVLDELMKKYDFIEAAWTNDKRGRFICSIPEAGIANALVRDWFKSSITGEEYVSLVYVSAITRRPCQTISLPIRNAKEEIVGVIGVDIKI